MKQNRLPTHIGKHAIVIGGSIAGLLTGCVLANYFELVTIIERDQALAGPEPSKGVPQGNHVHVLFASGAAEIERLFPGIFAELVEGGAHQVYAQGMTVSALEVEALERSLDAAARKPERLAGLAKHFFQRTTRIVDVAWLFSTSLDFVYPQTIGKRPLGMRLLHWDNAQLFELSGHSFGISRRFMEAIQFVASPVTLFHPAVFVQVLYWGIVRKWFKKLRTGFSEENLDVSRTKPSLPTQHRQVKSAS